jgi:hypothetical protein
MLLDGVRLRVMAFAVRSRSQCTGQHAGEFVEQPFVRHPPVATGMSGKGQADAVAGEG